MNEKPDYNNVSIKGTLEWGLCQELTNISNVLQILSENVLDLRELFITKMKSDNLTWNEVAEYLIDMSKQIKNSTDIIFEKFD